MAVSTVSALRDASHTAYVRGQWVYTDGSGEAQYRIDLPDYMPDPPSQQQLEMFDFNHDGLYNIDELAVALGFQPWPKGIH